MAWAAQERLLTLSEGSGWQRGQQQAQATNPPGPHTLERQAIHGLRSGPELQQERLVLRRHLPEK